MAELGLLRPPATVLFGNGLVERLGEVVRPWGPRGLVCTDAFIAGADQGERALRALRAEGLEVHVLPDALPELPRDSVERAIATAAAIEPDWIVALGGGSSLDFGKLIALGLRHGGRLDRFYGENAVPGPVVPVAAVPTTAGTGSEVTPVAVLSDPAIAMKVGISSPHLVPRVALCDPSLTDGAPRLVTAYAGIDALAHAIEAYTAVARESSEQLLGRVFVGRNLLSDGFALQAITRLGRSLRSAVDDDPGARADALAGSLCAGMAFATAGTAVAHALQYPVGARTKTPHGLGVGLLLPFAMRFNLPACRDRFADVARALGCQTPEEAVVHVRRLALDVGLPARLADIGVAEEELTEIAAQAMTIARLVDNNPRPLSQQHALAILTAAWHGDVERADPGPLD